MFVSSGTVGNYLLAFRNLVQILFDRVCLDVDRTGNVFDLELIRQAARSVTIPVVACGGAGALEHIRDVVLDGAADAVCVASMLHYDLLKRTRTDYSAGDEGNVEFLKQARGFSKIAGASVKEIKRLLLDSRIACRSIEKASHV